MYNGLCRQEGVGWMLGASGQPFNRSACNIYEPKCASHRPRQA